MLVSKYILRLQKTYNKHLLYAALAWLGTALLFYYLQTNPIILVANFLLVAVMVLNVAVAAPLMQNKPNVKRWLVPLTIATVAICLVVSKYLNTQGFAFIGISYLAFRLIHVIASVERLPKLSTADISTYALFPLAFVAGPIHRIDSFLPQIDKPRAPKSESDLFAHLTRIVYGLFKKFAIGNALSMVALNDAIATNPGVTKPQLLFSLIAFAFMIYFDFAGYSDIVIGIAGIIGFTLPENFQNPYAQPNIARFWQTWHMSLSFWLRDYLFFPISRSLLQRLGKRFSIVIMVFANVTTMLLAGLWHGFTVGFILWGIWHGLGLAFYTLWSGFLKRRGWRLPTWVGVILTFVFVVIGWTFFALGNDAVILFWRKLVSL